MHFVLPIPRNCHVAKLRRLKMQRHMMDSWLKDRGPAGAVRWCRMMAVQACEDPAEESRTRANTLESHQAEEAVTSGGGGEEVTVMEMGGWRTMAVCEEGMPPEPTMRV